MAWAVLSTTIGSPRASGSAMRSGSEEDGRHLFVTPGIGTSIIPGALRRPAGDSLTLRDARRPD